MKSVKLIAAVVVAAGAAVAQADVIASWGFTDLHASYNGTTGMMSAVAGDNGLIHTGGDVTRLAVPDATATYDTGFMSLDNRGQLDFRMNLSVTGKSGSLAFGAGSVTITDFNGDTLTADIFGLWIGGIGGPDSIHFNGGLSNVLFTNTSGDGMFNGSQGAFSMNFDGQPLEGAVVNVTIASGAGFFDSDFREVSMQSSGEIIPAPGSLALLGLGGLTMKRRRR
ncbi:MAG: PEP-CTERM sorting domain-containing protein [Planctomycetota bacterium]|nr:PEP-CTERM sorting domain-containing protein [Planctomycetota bacterium]